MRTGILDFLKRNVATIVHGDKWLVVDEHDNFKVYQRKYGAKNAELLICTSSEEKAIEILESEP